MHPFSTLLYAPFLYSTDDFRGALGTNGLKFSKISLLKSGDY